MMEPAISKVPILIGDGNHESGMHFHSHFIRHAFAKSNNEKSSKPTSSLIAFFVGRLVFGGVSRGFGPAFIFSRRLSGSTAAVLERNKHGRVRHIGLPLRRKRMATVASYIFVRSRVWFGLQNDAHK